jgi:hypothetical protein
MKSVHLRLIPVLFAVAACAQAQDASPADKDEQAVRREISRLDNVKPRPSVRPLNRVNLSYRLMFDAKTTFKGFGGYRATDPGLAGFPLDHFYDDGYNRVDFLGNNHSGQGFPNTTIFWGYKYQQTQNPNSADVAVAMHSAGTVPLADLDNKDPRHGFELTYQRTLGEFHNITWGVEAGFGFTRVDADENKTTGAPIVETTDSYAVPVDPGGGHEIPSAPYNGFFRPPNNNPFNQGSLLSDIPMRNFSAAGMAAVVSDRSFDANIWQLRLGPIINVPINRRLELELSAGVAMAAVDSNFQFTEQVFLPPTVGMPSGGASPVFHGSSQDDGILFGEYLAGKVIMPISPDANLFAGVQWEDVGQYHHSIGVHSTQLDLAGTVSVTIGFGLGF